MLDRISRWYNNSFLQKCMQMYGLPPLQKRKINEAELLIISMFIWYKSRTSRKSNSLIQGTHIFFKEQFLKLYVENLFLFPSNPKEALQSYEKL